MFRGVLGEEHGKAGLCINAREEGGWQPLTTAPPRAQMRKDKPTLYSLTFPRWEMFAFLHRSVGSLKTNPCKWNTEK